MSDYLDLKEYIIANESLNISELEKIISFRLECINFEKKLYQSKNCPKIYDKKMKYLASKCLIPLLRIENELFFNNSLNIEKEVAVIDYQLNSIAGCSVGFVNNELLSFEIFNEKNSLYNFKDKIIFLSKNAKAPSICEETYHSLQYFFNPGIEKEAAEIEAFSIRILAFPEDYENKIRIMPEAAYFKKMPLNVIKKF